MSDVQPDATLFEEGESVGEVVRRVFVELGSNVPIRTVTQAIIDRQLLPALTLSHFLYRGLYERVRKELSAKTREGLPFAQPTSLVKTAPWKQLDLFTGDEAFAMIARRVDNIHEDYAELVRLHAWCLEKFGDAPVIPELI
jgi:hypothetical protein